MDKVERWAGIIPEEELRAYRKAEFGQRIGFGRSPALLNIDTTNNCIDPSYALCGHYSEDLIRTLVAITACFRELGLPIYYSRRDERHHSVQRGIRNLNLGTSKTAEYTSDPKADEWPEAYAPRPEDVIIRKNKSSPFFGTPLDSFLRYEGIDTIVIVGTATSGCVRSAATDAYALNFRPIVVQDACGDRSPTQARANFFDMDMKYADVEQLDYVIQYLRENCGKRTSGHR